MKKEAVSLCVTHVTLDQRSNARTRSRLDHARAQICSVYSFVVFNTQLNGVPLKFVVSAFSDYKNLQCVLFSLQNFVVFAFWHYKNS